MFRLTMQLDRSVLQALPPEIRAEIEQEYNHIKENHELIRQLALPDTSNTDSRQGSPLLRHATLQDQGSSRGRGKSRGTVSGRGRGRGRGRGKDQTGVDGIGGGSSEGRGDLHGREGRQRPGRTSRAGKEETDHDTGQVPDLDEEFLAALPPDIRAEVEAAHRLEVMKNRQRQADLAAEARNRQAVNYDSSLSAREQGRFTGHPLLERPTLMGLRETSELREMLAEWVQSTLIQEEGTAENMQPTDSHARSQSVLYDEGPNPEDVQSFSNFISRVIFMERDLERVRVLLRYLRRKVEENERQAAPAQSNPEHIRVLMSWPEALTRIVDVARRLVSELYGGSLVLD